jgi:hypothetical protein
MLTLGLGLALTRAALEWGESALKELASIEAVAAQGPHPTGDDPPMVKPESGL